MSHEVVHAPHRPVHDRPTLVSFASIALWSWFVYGLGAALAFLTDEQDSPTWLSGLHGTSLAVGGVIGALLAPRLNGRFGRGAVTRVGVLGCAVTITLFCLPVPSAAWTIGWLFVATFFGNLLVVGVNAFVGTHQGAASAPAFTESAAVNALAGLLAPLAIGAAAATLLGWRAGVLAAVVAFCAVEIWRGRSVTSYGGPGQVETRRSSGIMPRRTYWAVGASMCYIGAEFCISLWGVQLIEERAGLSAAAASAGLGTFLGGLFVGRVLGSGPARRLDSEVLLRWVLGAGIVTFGLTWVAASAWLLLPSFFLTGVALSLSYPLTLARVLRAAGGRVDRAAAINLAASTAAIGAAPFVLGGLAGSVSVHGAFLIVPALLLVALLLVVLVPVPDVD
jgi:fucose permease